MPFMQQRDFCATFSIAMAGKALELAYSGHDAVLFFPEFNKIAERGKHGRKFAFMVVEVNTRTAYPYTATALIVVTFPDGY